MCSILKTQKGIKVNFDMGRVVFSGRNQQFWPQWWFWVVGEPSQYLLLYFHSGCDSSWGRRTFYFFKLQLGARRKSTSTVSLQSERIRSKYSRSRAEKKESCLWLKSCVEALTIPEATLLRFDPAFLWDSTASFQ